METLIIAAKIAAVFVVALMLTLIAGRNLAKMNRNWEEINKRNNH